jgi:hypothetical protein
MRKALDLSREVVEQLTEICNARPWLALCESDETQLLAHTAAAAQAKDVIKRKRAEQARMN